MCSSDLVSAPTVSVSGSGGGSGATFTAVLDGDAVDTVSVVSGGSGYKGTITVTFTGGSGSNAAGTATVASSTVTALTVVTAGTGYSSAPTLTIAAPPSGTTATATATITTAGLKIINGETYNSTYVNGAGVVGSFAAKYPGTLGNSIKVSMVDGDQYSGWDYENEFDGAPGTSPYATQFGGMDDEMHIIIIDEDGAITGTAGTILEKFAFVSKAGDAKRADGTNNYYKNVINARSQYVWWMDHVADATNWGDDAANTSFDMLSQVYDSSLSGGTDDFSMTEGQQQNAYELFSNAESYDISLVLMGKASATTTDYVISNIAETRLDCVVFASPEDVDTGDIIIGSTSSQVDQINAYRNALPSTSYAVLDSGFKYQYDRYNDKYRWVPLNGDTAGLCARTDYQNDPWFSPGGLNRGQIKNVVKLAHNPTKTDRDALDRKSTRLNSSH